MIILARPKNNPTNKYNQLFYDALEDNDVKSLEYSSYNLIFGKYTHFHMHWPESVLNEKNRLKGLLKIIKLSSEILLSRIRGKKVIFTLHNSASHEENLLYKTIYSYLVEKQVDYVHTLSDWDTRSISIRKRFRRSIFFCIPHGNYQFSYGKLERKDYSRNLLGIDKNDTLILFLGQIRKYKNVEALVKIFSGIEDSSLKLIIAGKPNYDLNLLEKEDSRIKFNLSFIEDDKIPIYLGAADIMIAPYSHISNSGSAILALSYGLPFMGPQSPALLELQKEYSERYIALYEGDLSEAFILRTIKNESSSNDNLPPDMSARNWDTIAKNFISNIGENK